MKTVVLSAVAAVCIVCAFLTADTKLQNALILIAVGVLICID